jgi:hypothetical protein
MPAEHKTRAGRYVSPLESVGYLVRLSRGQNFIGGKATVYQYMCPKWE